MKMEPDGLITSIWNSCVVFRPSAGKLAMLLITRNLEADAVERSKAAGERTPLGIRIL